MAPSKKDTLEMVFNEGWQLSFRIDNAESLVVPSLKFDVNLVSTPSTIYSPPYSLLGRKLFFPHPTPLQKDFIYSVPLQPAHILSLFSYDEINPARVGQKFMERIEKESIGSYLQGQIKIDKISFFIDEAPSLLLFQFEAKYNSQMIAIDPLSFSKNQTLKFKYFLFI